MDKMLRPILELTVIIPGLLLAYLPVRTYLRQPLHKLAVCFLCLQVFVYQVVYYVILCRLPPCLC